MKYPGEHTKKPHGNPPSSLPGYRLNDLERRGVPPENPSALSPGIAQLLRSGYTARFRRSVSVGAYLGPTPWRSAPGETQLAQGGTDGSNPPSSTGESSANLTSSPGKTRGQRYRELCRLKVPQ